LYRAQNALALRHGPNQANIGRSVLTPGTIDKIVEESDHLDVIAAPPTKVRSDEQFVIECIHYHQAFGASVQCFVFHDEA